MGGIAYFLPGVDRHICTKPEGLAGVADGLSPGRGRDDADSDSDRACRALPPRAALARRGLYSREGKLAPMSVR